MSGYNAYKLKTILTKENIVEVLESLGAHGINPRDTNGIRSSCPIHESSGSTVFTFNIDKNLYICYGECSDDKKQGDIITLVRHCQDCDYDSAFEYICEVCNLDIKLFQDNEEFILEELKIRLDNLLGLNDETEDENGLYYGVEPLDDSVLDNLAFKDDNDFISSQGFKDETLELFESKYSDSEKRWLLPQRNEDGLLLGFDGRDVTNKSKIKWKKRGGLLKNKILGRLDIVGDYIKKENKIILSEGKKDMIAIYEAGLKFSSCVYGSTLAREQKELIDKYIDEEIIIMSDGDTSGYNMAVSIVKSCYPEYLITAIEMPDEMDPADLSTSYMLELYNNRIPIEEWLKKYEYRAKKAKKKK